MPAGGGEQHSRLGLAAVTVVVVGVGAEEDIVERKLRSEDLMHGLQCLQGLIAARDVGLVGDDDEFVALVF